MTNLLEKFEFGDTLGSGTFAVVVRAKDRETGETYAMKVIDKSRCKGQEAHIVKEIAILKHVNHPNIIRLFDVYETKDQLFMQMECVSGGELFDRIIKKGYYTENDAKKIIKEILDATLYLHKQNIVHRDLKPENLLLENASDDSPIKLADFGLSTVVAGNSMLETSCGTMTYVAPEILMGRGYGKEVDMWSIGVITYILLSGYPPFYDEDESKTMEQTLKGQYKFYSPDWDDVSEEAKSFIRGLIVPDPLKRMSAQESIDHPFLKGESTSAQPDLYKHVAANIEKMFNARAKLKAGMDAVRIVNIFKSNLEDRDKRVAELAGNFKASLLGKVKASDEKK